MNESTAPVMARCCFSLPFPGKSIIMEKTFPVGTPHDPVSDQQPLCQDDKCAQICGECCHIRNGILDWLTKEGGLLEL